MSEEEYVFSGEIWVPVVLPTADGALPLTATSGDRVPVVLEVRREGQYTVLAVTFSLKMPFDGSPKALQPSPCVDGKLFMPGGVIDANFVLGVVRPCVLRLAIASNCASLLTTFDEADTSTLLRGVKVAVAASTYPLTPSPRYYGETQPHPTALGKDALREAVARGITLEDLFLAISDRAWARNDVYTMLASLTTAVEVAANNYRKCDKFNTPRDLGSTAFATASEDDYIACYELCETRHELVHNGKVMVRTFDRDTDRVDRDNLRPFTGKERVAFRRAAVAAICLDARKPCLVIAAAAMPGQSVVSTMRSRDWRRR